VSVFWTHDCRPLQEEEQRARKISSPKDANTHARE
jgi:hypothetical protein